jgi:hypothetical protein
LGRNFAIEEIKIFITEIIKNVKLEVLSKNVRHKLNLVTPIEGGLFVKRV